MRAFILGAGSSLYAGFPLGARLWDFLLDHCGLEMRAMETVSNYLSTLDKETRRNEEMNLESLLTRLERGEIPSMPAAAHAGADDRHQRLAVKDSLRHTLQNQPGFNFNSFWDAQRVRRQSVVTAWSHAQLNSMRDLVFNFVDAFLLHHGCLRYGRRHFHGAAEPWPSQSQSRFSRACPCRQRLRIGAVRRGFEAVGRRFQPGDVVITFNYDATIEASLWSAGKWHFGDGYGIPIDLTAHHLKPVVRRARFRSPSPVKVLKAHGSINWVRSLIDDSVGLNYLGLLFHLPAFSTYQPALDPESGWEDVHVERTLLSPTYQKDYSSIPTLAAVWDQIDDALRSASEITVVGYSLPDGDTDAKGRLENALRENKSCRRIGVVSPSDPAGGPWAALAAGARMDLARPASSMEAWIGSAVY
jgi:hypothetical protein